MVDAKSQPRNQPRFYEKSVSVIYYKYKVLANGESPLMLRIAKDGKRTMKSLGLSVNPAYRDFGKNQPKSNCPNKNLIKQLILKTEMKYQLKLLQKEIKEEEFTARESGKVDVSPMKGISYLSNFVFENFLSSEADGQ